MNFGPINQAGGEKRLNVIFSRAKHHMVVVSSIEHHQITNDHNVGANALKQYLRYAAAASIGDQDELRACLLQFGADRNDRVDNAPTTALAERLQKRLQGRGYDVEQTYGQSTVTCDLALRKSEDDAFGLALFLDDDKHYGTTDLVERYVTRPEIFRAFGWQVEHVLGLDWFRPERRLLGRIDNYFPKELDDGRPTLTVVE